MKKLLLVWLFLLFANHLVLAQSTPGFAPGQVPTAAQWNAAFAAKQDVLGYLPLSTLGGTMLGRLNTFASSAASAGLNIPQGTAPSSPVNGDIWATSAGVFAYINGSTVGPFGAGLAGTVTVPQGGTGQTTFTSNLPLIGNGAGAIAQGTRSGNTTSFATTSGVMTSGNCVSIDGSGNLVAAGGACTTGGGGGTVASSTTGQVAVYSAATTVTGIAACNNGYYGTDGAGAVLCRTSVNTTLSATITTLGTIATGVWQGTTIAAQFGGTGVNNGASTITIGGNITFSGAFPFTATLTASTSPTFPSGTYSVASQTGTSGGIPYYSSATTQASSGVLGANLPVFGGGAGSAPIAGTRSGNTTEVVTTTGAQTSGNCVSIDANGNHIASGAACAAGSSSVLLNTLTASNSTTLSDTTSFTSTYNSYTLVFIKLTPATTSDTCQIQVQASASFQATGYITQATAGVSTTTPTTEVPCSFAGQNPISGGNGVSGSLTVYKPSDNAKALWGGHIYNFYGVTEGNISTVDIIGKWNTAAVVTGFQVFYNSAAGSARTNGIASGIVEVWGNP